MKTVGYIRVSTEDQAREGVSLDAQKAKIQAYCSLKDLELVEVIEDAGLSGKNLNRPGAQRILELARSKKIDSVVVLKLDRMFRSTVDALETTKMLDKLGVGFHSIHENLDTKSAMGRFFFTLTAALAEMERAIIAERTRMALAHKRSKMEKTGGTVPYGYDCKNGKLTENRLEQEGLKLIKKFAFEMNLKPPRIAEILTEAGFPPKMGRYWNPDCVRRIVNRLRSTCHLEIPAAPAVEPMTVSPGIDGRQELVPDGPAA